MTIEKVRPLIPPVEFVRGCPETLKHSWFGICKQTGRVGVGQTIAEVEERLLEMHTGKLEVERHRDNMDIFLNTKFPPKV
jgi:hypothetical protein